MKWYNVTLISLQLKMIYIKKKDAVFFSKPSVSRGSPCVYFQFIVTIY